MEAANNHKRFEPENGNADKVRFVLLHTRIILFRKLLGHLGDLFCSCVKILLTTLQFLGRRRDGFVFGLDNLTCREGHKEK